MIIKLRNCPFCGGKAEITQKWNLLYAVRCTECGAQSAQLKNRNDAVSRWNRDTFRSDHYYGQLFHTRIEKMRKDRCMSQRDLAIAIHTGTTIIREAEKGKFYHEIDFIVNLADFFGVSIDYLIRGKSSPGSMKMEEHHGKIESETEKP